MTVAWGRPEFTANSDGLATLGPHPVGTWATGCRALLGGMQLISRAEGYISQCTRRLFCCALFLFVVQLLTRYFCESLVSLCIAEVGD